MQAVQHAQTCWPCDIPSFVYAPTNPWLEKQLPPFLCPPPTAATPDTQKNYHMPDIYSQVNIHALPLPHHPSCS